MQRSAKWWADKIRALRAAGRTEAQLAPAMRELDQAKRDKAPRPRKARR